jgi:hypothetical protein
MALVERTDAVKDYLHFSRVAGAVKEQQFGEDTAQIVARAAT